MPFTEAHGVEEHLVRARLVLMGRLEASLRSGQKALLTLDLAAIESVTADQIGLVREFDGLLRQTVARAECDRSAVPQDSGLRAGLSEAKAELRETQKRIVSALRLQTALLARAEGKLRVLGNMLAGPAAPYCPAWTRDGGLAHQTGRKQAERIDSCRG